MAKNTSPLFPCGIKLSTPGKMPGYTLALPAQSCSVGSKLRQVKGSVCSSCYARKGHYCFGAAKDLRDNNLSIIRSSIPQGVNAPWVKELAEYLFVSRTPFFRFHDSGDLLCLDHLRQIVHIAKACPHTFFWLPTKEYGIVKAFQKVDGAFPSNLVVRVSSPMVGQKPLSIGVGLATSTVNCEGSFNCPVSNGKESCDNNSSGLTCRACWQGSCTNVNYRKH